MLRGSYRTSQLIEVGRQPGVAPMTVRHGPTPPTAALLSLGGNSYSSRAIEQFH